MNSIRPIAYIKFELKISARRWNLNNYLAYHFRGLGKRQTVLLTHGDSVEKVAENFKCIANSSSNIAGIANEKAHIYGLQFHPEVSGSLDF